MSRTFSACALAVSVLALACGPGAEDPGFPEDYAASYVEVRDCRRSGDHELHYIRILADPASADAYLERDRPFPEGAIVLKEEYDFGDDTCAGEIVRWTVMERLPEGSSADTLGWRWVDVDADRAVLSEDDARCVGCHQLCVEPGGYESTCAEP